MAATNIGVLRARGRKCAPLLACLACAWTALAVLVPAVASAAGAITHTDSALGISIPASARVRGAASTAATTTTPGSAITVPAKTTPAPPPPGSATPAGSTPGGAQPGTIAPTTTPAASTPATTTTSTTPPATTTRSGTVVVVTHKTTSKGTHLSTAALVLAILGALLALGAIVWALARWLALEPHWTVSLMYSLREASSRASATWAEFSDWVRLGN
jgi:hypothetical protein